MNVVIIINST